MNFPDIEALVRQHLMTEAYGLGAEVYTTVPATAPDRFVRMWRNGGASINRVLDRPHITVEAWSHDSVDAADLANRCRQILLAASGSMPLVRSVSEVSGPYRVDDETTETPRYRFTVALSVRAKR